MQRNIKRLKIEKKPIDEEAMRNAFNNKVCVILSIQSQMS